MRNINTERGDTDHLRAILKERDRIIEEQRVGKINQEAQIKDMRKQVEELEQSSASCAVSATACAIAGARRRPRLMISSRSWIAFAR